MSDRDFVAPSLDDLAYAQVKNSRLFGLTNLSGKALALSALGAFGTGVTGTAQLLGWVGAVGGVTLTFPVSLGFLGGSVVAAAVSYWLGNYDDRHIEAHNQRHSGLASSFHNARQTDYNRIQNQFIEALRHITAYDPREKMLPYDVLGHAVLLDDSHIQKLPPHVQIDILRTQLDLELFRAKRVISDQTHEGRDFEAMVFDNESLAMEERAKAYFHCRDHIRRSLTDGTLRITRIDDDRADGEGRSSDVSENTADFMEAVGDALSSVLRRSGSRSGSGSSWTPGGGSFGGGGASGEWGAVTSSLNTTSTNFSSVATARPAFVPAPSSSGGESSSGLDLGLGDLDMDEDTFKALPAIILIGAAVVAVGANAASMYKNFISKAPKPVLLGVDTPLITQSLRSADKEIRQMYKIS
jgi:uncharacterized membrane protein YgcG